MMSNRYYAFLAAAGMLLVSGVTYHSLASDSALLEEAAARVPQVPTVVGDWHGQDEPTDDRSFQQTGARAYWMRQYVNQKTRASVLAILMCGRPGKMAVHTPEVCYSGAGYVLQGQPAAIGIKNDRGEETGTFWTAEFKKKSGQLRLCWGWNAHGTWEASTAPRWQYRGEPFLYKLYVSREASGKADVEGAADFLQEFVPVLKETLLAS
jgi:hypothetical protein